MSSADEIRSSAGAGGIELAAVVLSYRNQPGLVDAVRSLVAQDERVEVVIVNSGGGMPEATLREAGLAVPVINRAERLFAGGARNIGIAVTCAPYVAFLAADCQAQPGWVRGRLRVHRSGALAVSSAVINPYRDNPAAWAAHILGAARRMPGTPLQHHVDYGVSYARALFERCGAFREDLRIKEDTEFNRRLTRTTPIRWAPDVCTAHRYPLTKRDLLRDQFARGSRDARVLRLLNPRSHNRNVAAGWLVRTRVHVRIARASGEQRDLAAIDHAMPLTVAAGMTRSLGALVG